MQHGQNLQMFVVVRGQNIELEGIIVKMNFDFEQKYWGTWFHNWFHSQKEDAGQLDGCYLS